MQFNSFEWLDYIAASNEHEVLRIWIHNKDIFFNRFMIINDDDKLIIGDKINKSLYEFTKTKDRFNIKFNKDNSPKSLKLFGIGNIEVMKKIG